MSETMETTGEARQMEPHEVLDALRDNLYIRGLRHVDAWSAQGAESRLVKLTQEVERLGIAPLAQGLGGWREWRASYVLLREVEKDLAQFKSYQDLTACGEWAAKRGPLMVRNIKTLCDDPYFGPLGHLVRNLDGFQEWRADGLEWVFGLRALCHNASAKDWLLKVARYEDLYGWRFDGNFAMYHHRDFAWELRATSPDQWTILDGEVRRLNRRATPTRRAPEEWPLYRADGLSRFIGANRAWEKEARLRWG